MGLACVECAGFPWAVGGALATGAITGGGTGDTTCAVFTGATATGTVATGAWGLTGDAEATGAAGGAGGVSVRCLQPMSPSITNARMLSATEIPAVIPFFVSKKYACRSSLSIT